MIKMTRIYNHGIYLLCDGKDMLVNLGEEDIIIKDLCVTHMDNRQCCEMIDVTTLDADSRLSPIAAYKHTEINLTLRGGEVIIGQNLQLNNIKDIYKMSIFDIMKIVNERLKNE